ncbi:hypothetical protein KI387_014223, partial [Taxus chinensis]
AQRWPGKQIHSFNYRVPEPFSNQVVVIIGSSSSAVDISSELKVVAKEVHLSVRSTYMEHKESQVDHFINHLNLPLHPTVQSLDENGAVVFEDGSSIIADSIIHCTGYRYSLPFLDTNGVIKVDDSVGPLYEHIFPPLLAPSLSFVGIPKKVLTFPFFELQSKWITSILARKSKLPSRRGMMKAVKEFYDYQEMIGLSKCSAHDIGNFEYCDQLADWSGASRFEEWRKEIALEEAISEVETRHSVEQSIATIYEEYMALPGEIHDVMSLTKFIRLKKGEMVIGPRSKPWAMPKKNVEDVSVLEGKNTFVTIKEE